MKNDTMTSWHIKRIYEEPTATDGYRVLVDRLWPRGISKETAHLDEWCKDVAPSTEARRDFGHDPSRFEEFRDRYRAELKASGAAGALVERLADQPVVTLLYAAHDPRFNHAVVLQEVLEDPQATS